jgi:hypothetical protein
MSKKKSTVCDSDSASPSKSALGTNDSPRSVKKSYRKPFCPVLADLNASHIHLQRELRRIRRDLRHCAHCKKIATCPGQQRLREVIQQAIRESYEELRANARPIQNDDHSL